MRKFVSILFILVLVFAHAGYLGVYVLQQQEAKEAMAQKIRSGHLDQYMITIDPSDFAPNALHWIEENKEFSLHGQVYDVVKIENVNGRTKISCVSDADEQNILNKEKETTGKQSQQQSSQAFFKIFVAAPIATAHNGFLFAKPQTVYNLYCIPQTGILHAEILAPPPQFV